MRRQHTAVLLFGLLTAALLAGRLRADAELGTARVRFLLVIDTLGANAEGNGFPADRVTMKKVLREALREQNLEDCYTLDVLDGREATPERVLTHYRDLKVSPDDVLVCYYSGHGGADKQRGHFLDLRAGRLDRAELRRAMEAKKPRLLVLLSDCCANYGGTRANRIAVADDSGAKKGEKPTRQKADGGARQNTVRSIRGETLRHLLLHHRGVVDITACDLGTLALSKQGRGGYFTLALANLLGADGDRFEAGADGRIGWGGFFHVLQRMTEQAATNATYTQSPRAFSLPTTSP